MLIIYSLLAYGITNIMVFGSIFKEWRDFWEYFSPNFFGKLFGCPMCLSTWVGFFLSILFHNLGSTTPMLEYGMEFGFWSVLFDGVFTSGVVWLLHTIQEAFERAFPGGEE
jgi:ABC-type polysaccharide/polyol phosphate export permease